MNAKDLAAVLEKHALYLKGDPTGARANLRSANLRSADLRSANLRCADLSVANLRSADLRSADLRSADLSGADLSGADLSGANLFGANLYGADLSGAKNASDKLNAETSIVPETGGFQGWKKCQNGVIVQLHIPASARRSNATGRKCRAERALVLQVFGGDCGISQYEYAPKVYYNVGQTAECNQWNTDCWTECGGGIHFFLTRYEAEHYN